jgi:hypothetical protein
MQPMVLVYKNLHDLVILLGQMLVCIFQHHGSHLGHSSEIFSIWGLNWDDFPYKGGPLVAELNILTPGTIGFI